MVDKKLQGKKNRVSGAAFEKRVRQDLEEKGWICDRWTNNVELTMMTKGSDIEKAIKENGDVKVIATEYEKLFGKLIQAKAKWNNFTRSMIMGKGGFPDFIAFKFYKGYNGTKTYEVFGVEVKSNGRLDKEERAKCQWLLKNNIFSSIKVARKTKVKNRIVIEYKEFE